MEARINTSRSAPTEDHLKDAQLIWDYHQMHQPLRQVDVGIGLGSHDLGVATFSADVYHRGFFPSLVFTGGTSRTTAAQVPRGEAVHYRERAIELGVPDSAVVVEPRATNIGQNIAFAREILTDVGRPVGSVLLISKPYMERRAFATCQKVWPEVEVVCASEPAMSGG
ncbi:YdcF family protein [Kribbella endophytica]